jgi:arylsulfatase A-like enzyme
MKVPIKYEMKYMHIKDIERRKYLGQVSMLDETIGNITSKLKELDMLDNTLIFFTSDNGGAVYTAGRNFPLRGFI